MVVLIVHTLGILTGKAECDAPVAAHFDRPCTFSGTLELVKIQTWQRHIARVCGRIQPAQHQAEPVGLLGLNASLVPGGEEAFKPFVSKALDRH